MAARGTDPRLPRLRALLQGKRALPDDLARWVDSGMTDRVLRECSDRSERDVLIRVAATHVGGTRWARACVLAAIARHPEADGEIGRLFRDARQLADLPTSQRAFFRILGGK